MYDVSFWRVCRHAVPALRCGYSPLSVVQTPKVAPEAVVHTYHGPMKKVRKRPINITISQHDVIWKIEK